jgi:hypothetical protein
MSDQPLIPEGDTSGYVPNLVFDPEERRFNPLEPVKWYAFVINGEVVWMQTVSVSLEYLVAVMSSSPQVIEIPEPLMGQVLSGWTYDGTTFHPPAGA